MRRLLLPIAESPTLRQTVEYAVESGVRDVDEVAFRVVQLPELRPDHRHEPATTVDPALLARVEGWIEETATGVTADIHIETATIDRSTPLFTPIDVAEVLIDEIDRHAIDRVVLDPGYGPRSQRDFLSPLAQLLREETGIRVDVAPFQTSRGLLPGSLDVPRIVFVFLVSLGFYLVLAGGVSQYAVVTGVATAAIVTATVGAITLWFPPETRYTPARFLRALVYIPYLLASIIRSNLSVSRVILDPALPIDTALVRYHPAISGPFPLTTLANSITLTPGTLSVRVDEGVLIVHTLTTDARTDLLDGGLERAVRFLFFGRHAMRIPSPAERADATVIETPGMEEAAE